MTRLLSDADVAERIFSHIDNKTTDAGDRVWREPTGNYRSEERFAAEMALLRRLPVPFCPSAALPGAGAYVARLAAGTPLLVVRGDDGEVRAFRNACRHRGLPVAEGSGCARAFVCGYHAWTYGLDGALKHIPNAEGFPDVAPEEHGLIPVAAEEKGGLVFVTQETPLAAGGLAHMPDLLAPEQQIFDQSETTDTVNWKLTTEAAMEGYHIKHGHTKTFYPYGFDNLNVIELHGPNARVIFPFRRIEKMRGVAPGERRLNGLITDVFHIFPNVHLSVLTSHTILHILEPEAPGRTRHITYRLTNKDFDGSEESLARARRDADFVANEGGEEDRELTRGIQQALPGGGNSHFTFGHYEQAIVNFHASLTEMVAAEAQSDK
jgi:phenylpropionate dioxygenase-like ring-hydroxylating dioxygenase large terminal subunit